MKRSNTSIDDILISGRINSLKIIKNELRIKRNISLIHFLMRYFRTKVSELNYSVDLNLFIEIIGVLRFIKPETSQEFEVVKEYVESIKLLIQEKQTELGENKEMVEFLCMLNERIGEFLIETRFSMLDENNQVFPNIDAKIIKSIVNDYIFAYKDYGHLNLLLSLYPDMCKAKLDSEAILIKSLREYFAKPQEREFLSRIMTLLVTKLDFYLSIEVKGNIRDLCSRNFCKLSTEESIFIKEILTTLGIKEEIKPEQKLYLLKTRFGINDFELKDLNLSYTEVPVDMTDRVAITIDDIEACIFDDAFSIKKNKNGTLELGLYIVDTSFIEPGSPLDIYAYNHFSSIYADGLWISMLPWKVSADLSLNKGLKRVIAYTFRFNSNYELIDSNIAPAIINVRSNLIYDETTTILKERLKFYETLSLASDLTEALVDSLGTIDRYHRIKERFRKSGNNRIPEKYLYTPGNRIISTFAVFLNNYIAKTFKRLNVPFIYCVNGIENSEDVKTQIEVYGHEKDICDILSALQKLNKESTFSSINTGHRGLGLDYTQTTNPVRFYPSLMVQRMTTDFFIKGMPLEEYMKKYATVEEQARAFTLLKRRNLAFTAEYNNLCKDEK